MHRFIAKIFILFFIILPGTSTAADYNQWLPYIPKSMNGLQAVDENDGMNMSMNDMDMSSVNRSYGKDDTMINLSITYSSTGAENQSIRPLMAMRMETGEFSQQSIKLQDFDGIYQHDKTANRVSIMLLLKDKGLVIFESPAGKPQKHYLDMLNKVDFKKIAATF